MKDDVEPETAASVKEYLDTILDTTLILNETYKVKLLKTDVKERKGRYLMILRYQIEN